MSGDKIRQHQCMARGESIDVAAIESPFKCGPDHGKPARGTLLDSQRGASRGGKISHGSTGYDD